MGRKIFVSYKYNDSSVEHIPRFLDSTPTTARHYVDVLQTHLDAEDHINKGEDDGEDLTGLSDEYIESLLSERMFDSSITIVLISKNMKETGRNEKEQWIPWEISYSLREKTRGDKTSSTNAMLAVVLPDENGSYEYFVQPLNCQNCYGITWKKDTLFAILGNNMFNRKNPNTIVCNTGHGTLHNGNDHSYIHPVRWKEFMLNINWYLDFVTQINKSINDYEVVKVI